MNDVLLNYYGRFLERGNLQDTPEAFDMFNLISQLAGYHGEEQIELIGDYITRWEKEQFNPRLREKEV